MVTQRVALVTGCSEPTSLGAAFARELKSKGWRVFATARNADTLKELEAEGCDVLALDVTSDESVREAVEQFGKRANRLDLLINNAGVAALAPILDFDVDRLRAVYDVNVFGLVRVTQGFSDLLVRTANHPDLTGVQGKSTIVNISSTARFIAPWQGAYGSSKAAAARISDTMRVELGQLGVKVITIDLSSVKTAMTAKLKPFNIVKPDPSPYFDYPKSIEPKASKLYADSLKSAPEPEDAARQIIALVEKRSPPAFTLMGSTIWLFKYLMPLLSLTLFDSLFSKALFLKDVKRPKIV